MALKSNKKAGFVYKPRTADQIKDRANRKVGNYDSIFKQGYDTFTARTGDNLVRYIPPTWDDSDHYGFTIFVHNNIGPDNATYLCPRKMLNKPCAICEAAKEAKDAGENEEAKALGTSERVVSWILDREGDDPEKPVLWSQSWTQDRDVSSLCVNERTGEVLMIDHPDKGFDVSFKRTGTGLKTKYYGWQVDRNDSVLHENEKVQDEILDYVRENPVPDALNFYDYDYLKGVLSGAVEAKDKDIKDDEDDQPRGRPTSRRGSAVEEDDVPFDTEKNTRRGPRRDEDPEDAEPEDEEVVPAARSSRRAAPPVEDEDAPAPRRSSARRPDPVDEEVDEEAEETAPPPRRASSRRVVEEDPEDEEAAPAPRRGRTR